jgi:hypothetical protein
VVLVAGVGDDGGTVVLSLTPSIPVPNRPRVAQMAEPRALKMQMGEAIAELSVSSQQGEGGSAMTDFLNTWLSHDAE